MASTTPLPQPTTMQAAHVTVGIAAPSSHCLAGQHVQGAIPAGRCRAVRVARGRLYAAHVAGLARRPLTKLSPHTRGGAVRVAARRLAARVAELARCRVGRAVAAGHGRAVQVAGRGRAALVTRLPHVDRAVAAEARRREDAVRVAAVGVSVAVVVEAVLAERLRGCHRGRRTRCPRTELPHGLQARRRWCTTRCRRSPPACPRRCRGHRRTSRRRRRSRRPRSPRGRPRRRPGSCRRSRRASSQGSLRSRCPRSRRSRRSRCRRRRRKPRPCRPARR
jgi:hypothetical protein